MDIPANPHKLGRLAESAGIDDLIGTTIVAGHVSDLQDRPGAFGRLNSAQPGDVISYRGTDGQVHRFKVTRTATYDRERALPRRLFRTTGAHRLVLISCTDRATYPGGGWHYRKNIVVTATPIG